MEHAGVDHDIVFGASYILLALFYTENTSFVNMNIV